MADKENHRKLLLKSAKRVHLLARLQKVAVVTDKLRKLRQKLGM